MPNAMTPLVGIAAIVALAAPTLVWADEPSELSRRERGDLAIHARAILKQHCYECHGGAKTRSTLTVLEYAKLTATGNPVPFVAPKNVPGSQIIQFIEDGSMPPGNRPRLKPEEVEVLKRWVAEAAPSFPAAFDDAGTVQSIINDLASHQADAAHLRYFSFSHLVREDSPPPNLKKAESDLNRALASVGVLGDSSPEPVDDSATLFRFDVRKVGWDNRQLFHRFDNRVAGGISPLSAYDVLLLEYPHGSLAQGDKRLDEYFASAKLVVPVPFLRADWVSRALLAEKNEPHPLADDLRSLTELSAALAKEKFPDLGREEKTPCGPKVRPFGNKNPVPAAAKPETKSPILPFSSWYAGDVQADPPPFNVAAEVVSVEGKPLKSIQTGQPFQLKVTAKRNVHFALYLVQADGSVRLQPTNKNGFFDKDEVVLSPGTNAPFKIVDVITGEQKATEYFVLLASEAVLPPVNIVRSRHSRGPECAKGQFPIYRLLFDREKQPDGFDPAKVVRKVIPVPVTGAKSD